MGRTYDLARYDLKLEGLSRLVPSVLVSPSLGPLVAVHCGEHTSKYIMHILHVTLVNVLI